MLPTTWLTLAPVLGARCQLATSLTEAVGVSLVSLSLEWIIKGIASAFIASFIATITMVVCSDPAVQE